MGVRPFRIVIHSPGICSKCLHYWNWNSNAIQSNKSFRRIWTFLFAMLKRLHLRQCYEAKGEEQMLRIYRHKTQTHAHTLNMRNKGIKCLIMLHWANVPQPTPCWQFESKPNRAKSSQSIVCEFKCELYAATNTMWLVHLQLIFKRRMQLWLCICECDGGWNRWL